MNSTDNGNLETMLGSFFDTVLAPMAAQLRAEGTEVFPLRPDVSWLSYYVRRKRSVMVAGDFRDVSCRNGDEVAQRLQARWQAAGRHELAAQAGYVGWLAEVARASQAGSAPAEVSPYVYAMF